MQKIINILIISILSVILIGLVVFGVSFGKDILTNDNTKAHSANKNQNNDNKSKKEQKKEEKQDDETMQTNINKSNVNDTTEQITNAQSASTGVVSNTNATQAQQGSVAQPNSGTSTSIEHQGYKMSQQELDHLSKAEQEGIGYNPNNPRGDVGGPGMSAAHDGIGNDDEDIDQ